MLKSISLNSQQVVIVARQNRLDYLFIVRTECSKILSCSAQGYLTNKNYRQNNVPQEILLLEILIERVLSFISIDLRPSHLQHVPHPFDFIGINSRLQ